MPRSKGVPLRMPKMIINKGSQTRPMFPSKRALRDITRPGAQTVGNYAKMTPSGANAIPDTYTGIMNESLQGPQVVPALTGQEDAEQ